MSPAPDPALAALWTSSVARPLEDAERRLAATPPDPAGAATRLRAAERSVRAAAAAVPPGDPLRARLDAVAAGMARAAADAERGAPDARAVAALRRVAADLLG